MVIGGANCGGVINNIDKRNFWWITESMNSNRGYYNNSHQAKNSTFNTQKMQQTNLNHNTSVLTQNEKSFYTSFTKREA